MNRRTQILVGVAVVLAILLGLRQFVWTGDDGIVRPAPPPAQVEIRRETGNFLPDYAAFDAIADRPLFRPDRRPAPAAEVETVIPPQVTLTRETGPQFVVIGIGTNENGGVATIRNDSETVRAYVGDRIEGWRVDAVNRDSVEVSNDGRSYRLYIGEDTD